MKLILKTQSSVGGSLTSVVVLSAQELILTSLDFDSSSPYLEYFGEESLSDLVEPEVVEVVERLDRRPDGVARQGQLRPRVAMRSLLGRGGPILLVDGRERRRVRGPPLGPEAKHALKY